MNHQPPLKIMLVDDEPDILDFLRYGLAKAGYETETASGGLEAIEKAANFHPDLVVLDIMMPEYDGIRVCDHFKKSSFTKQTAVLFLTAGSPQFARHAMKVAQADDYVLKPILPSDFLGRIRILLQRYGKLPKEETFVLQVGDATLNRVTREFITPKRYVKLQEIEFNLVWLLASQKEKVFSSSEIRKKLRADLSIEPFPVKKNIIHLREKIGQGYIRTVAGQGYRFEG